MKQVQFILMHTVSMESLARHKRTNETNKQTNARRQYTPNGDDNKYIKFTKAAIRCMCVSLYIHGMPAPKTASAKMQHDDEKRTTVIRKTAKTPKK